MNMTVKLACLAVTATLAACGGGGGTPAPALTATLVPGIWNKTDNSTSSTKFIGVVTTSGSGGEVWAWTKDQTSSKMFTGTVSASGESFVTSQGTLLSYSSQTAWAEAATGKSLTLPKSTTTGQQVFDFGSAITYTTVLDSLWSTTASLTSANDWNASWTLSEQIPNPTDGGVTELTVTYVWNVLNGAISGSKTVAGQPPCSIKPGSAVTAREQAVVNVNVTYVCTDGETAYSGISFPLASAAGVVSSRAVWMRQTGTDKFVVQKFDRSGS